MTKTTTQYKLFSATSALIIWGSWSYHVNSVENKTTGLISGVTQGIASFIITLIAVYTVTKIYNALPAIILKPIVPAIIVVSCIGTILSIIHKIVGTPHILTTIAPSLTVAFLFCFFTTYKLNKTEVVNE